MIRNLPNWVKYLVFWNAFSEIGKHKYYLLGTKITKLLDTTYYCICYLMICRYIHQDKEFCLSRRRISSLVTHTRNAHLQARPGTMNTVGQSFHFLAESARPGPCHFVGGLSLETKSFNTPAHLWSQNNARKCLAIFRDFWAFSSRASFCNDKSKLNAQVYRSLFSTLTLLNFNYT